MTDFLSRLGGSALEALRGTPLDRILNYLMGDGTAGLAPLVDRLRQGGLGREVESWVATGRNEPVTPDQLEQALGEPEVDRLSREGGVDRGGLLGGLSALLPALVDGLTPRGRLPESEDEMREGGLGELLGDLLRGGHGGAWLGGLLGGAAAGGGGLATALGTLLGGQGASPEAGTGAAGGLESGYGGVGGAAHRHPGIGASFDPQRPEDDRTAMPRIGPAPLPEAGRAASQPAGGGRHSGRMLFSRTTLPQTSI